MAEVLEDFKFNGTHRGSKYPWKEWTNGQTWLAIKGEDYVCQSGSFRGILRSRAKFQELIVRTRTNKKGIVFQFSNKDGVYG